MTLNLYAIKDELNGFTPPVPFMSEELAKRYLKDQVIENPTFKNSPKDFSLWHVGIYDTETAEFTQNDIRLIERAENYAN